MTTAPVPSTYPPELAGDYEIDPAHSRFGFVARHALVTKVRGAFPAAKGAIQLDPTDPTRSSASVSVEVKSVDTGNEQRDAHLRTNDFFDADNYPTITFTSTGITPRGAETFQVAGDLTIRGVTRPVTLEVGYTGAAKDASGNERIGLEATTEINRKDFGVNWNAPLEAGGVLVSEKVTLEIDISATKKQDA